MSTPAAANKTKKSRVVKIALPSTILARFPSEQNAPSVQSDTIPSLPQPESVDKYSESNATPVPTTDAIDNNNSLAPPKADGRRKRGGAAPSGRKRAPPSIDPNAPMRERARPGPKKKPRLADGTIDQDPNAPARPNAVPAHRLGPKANTGAINAGLRALDRTGKPCRKWERKGFQLKSFTGTVWDMPSWKAPPRDQGFPGDVKSDSSESGAKQAQGSSERSQSHGGDQTMMTGMESSPVRNVTA